MKFATEHSVTNINERCGPAGFYDFVRASEHIQGNDIVTDFNILVGFRYKIIKGCFSVFSFVKRGVSGCKHFSDFFRHVKSVILHLLNGFLNADGIPCFKGTHFKIVSPFHGIVYFNHGVGNLRDPVGSIDQTVCNDFPYKLGAFVLAIHHSLYFFRQGFCFFCFAKAGKTGLVIFGIFKGFRIDGLSDDLFSRFFCFVKTASGFFSKEPVFNHFVDKFGDDKALPLFIIRNQVISVFGYMCHGIQAHKVTGLEHGGFGPSQHSAEKGICFRYGKPVLKHHLHGLYHALNTDPVPYEIGRVFCPDNAFSKFPLSVICHEFKNFRQSFFPRYDFKKLHISYRIEKMGSQKMLSEFLAQTLGHAFQGDSRCVRGNNGRVFPDSLKPLQKFLLDFQIFNNHFHNPVTIPKLVKIIFEIADGDEVRIFFAHQKRGF